MIACDLCGGSQWERVTGNLMKRCGCFLPTDLQEQELKQMRLPVPLRNKEFSNYTPRSSSHEKALELLQKLSIFVEDAPGAPVPKGALLTGPSGMGKTHLAVSLLKELRRIGFSGLYIPYIEWIENIRTQYQSRRAGITDPFDLPAVQELIAPDVLVLDGIAPSPGQQPILADTPADLIRLRHNLAKTLIITTRLPVEDANASGAPSLTLELGYPTVSRLYEGCAILEL